MITTLAVHGYRSLRDLVVELGPLTVVTGANGTGKSNLYRAFRLLADVADGNLIASLAQAGGLGSVLWAGPEMITTAMKRGDVPVQGTGSRKSPVSLQMGFASDELGYLVDVGLPTPGLGHPRHPAAEMFLRDPILKREAIFTGPVLRRAATLATRPKEMDPRRSMLADLPGSEEFPEVTAMRRLIRGWRFHDTLRVDEQAPARLPQVITHTPVMGHDGADLAAALLTIHESAWGGPLREAVAEAFQGATLDWQVDDVRGIVALRQPGMLRAMGAHELSDGTLRFLYLAAALLSPQPPSLLVLNEPESSLHPDVLPTLAALILNAAAQTQVLVVSHAPALVDPLLRQPGCVHHELTKELGETVVAGRGLFDRPTWDWGRR